MNLPPAIKSAVTSRLKILAQLDIAERRVPQDGRIKMRFGKKKTVDFRVSTLPTLFPVCAILSSVNDVKWVGTQALYCGAVSIGYA